MQRLRRACLLAVAVLLGWVSLAAGQATFANPVIPGDHPDPTVVRIGGAFYASATSASWAPSFPVWRSRDMVSWQQVGAVLPRTPSWASGGLFAPELVAWDGGVLAYYSAHRGDGHSCLAVARAGRPEGPWIAGGPLLCPEGGGIDADPFQDADGSRWLVYRHLGVGIEAVPLDASGTRVTGPVHLLLAAGQPWEHGVVEGPSVVRRGSDLLMLFAGGGCCRPPCSYAEGAAIATSLLGPWTEDAAGPVMAGNASFGCPGHGTVVSTAAGSFLLHHAVAPGDVGIRRRPVLLDPIDLGPPGGFPVINGGAGPLAAGPAPLGTAAAPAAAGFDDELAGRALGVGWEWLVGERPAFRVGGGRLALSCAGGPPAFLARQVPVDAFTASARVEPRRSASPGGAAGEGDAASGLAVHGPGRLLRGVELRAGRARAFRIAGSQTSYGPGRRVARGPARLRVTQAADGTLGLSVKPAVGPAVAVPAGPARLPASDGAATRVAVSCRGSGTSRFDEVRVSPAPTARR